MAVRSLLIIILTMTILSCTAAVQQEAKKPDVSQIPAIKTLLPPPPPAFKEPVIVEDPLEGVYVSMDAVEESLSSILYMVAAESGLNLIVSPDINVTKPFSITVNNMPARDVLEIVSENTGLYYEVKGNALKIVGHVTKTFRMPYVSAATTRSSEIGGDVFGSAESNLKGDYSLKYESSAKDSNVQSQIMRGLYGILFPKRVTDHTEEGDKSADENSDTNSDGEDAEKIETAYYRGVQGYIFNKFTGILKVTCAPAKMRLVESYMEDVLKELDKQVLIEAKMVEVTLDDSNEYGIDWAGVFSGKVGGTNFSSNVSGLFGTGTTGFIGSVTSNSASGILSLIASTAKVESVGNPSIRLMNGQSAMISSGQLIPYWEMDRETDNDTGIATISYTRVTVLDGIVMGVTAHVREDDSITLNIVPVFSDVKTEKKIVNEAGEVVASYPIVNLKEAGTVLNVKSGNTIIMGGLISKEDTVEEQKIPGLGDIPLIGYLFKSKKNVTAKSELVIFLTATIING